MKNLLFVLLICLGVQHLHAQDPDLYRTWYLYELLASDANEHFIIDDFDPAISPNLSISNTLEFNGTGACNTFMGTFDYDGTFLISTGTTATSDPCGSNLFDEFELDYFYFFDLAFFHQITEESDGFELRLSNGIFGFAIFKDYALSVNENSLNSTTLFPNPVSETLFILSEGTPIQSITIYSISGKRILSETSTTNQIDVSGLKAGLYFAEITTSEGQRVQKFIKD